MRWLDSITDSMDMNLSKLWETVFWPGEFYGLYRPWGRKESDMIQQLNNSQWPQALVSAKNPPKKEYKYHSRKKCLNNI